MIETIVRKARLREIDYIDSLRKKNGDALGFIPKQTYEAIVNKHKKLEDLYVAEDNGDLTGFAYVSFASEMAVIVQISIQEDARRFHRALLLLDVIENEAHRTCRTGIRARVAADLESNFFWKACGFIPARIATATHFGHGIAKSGRQIIVYVKHFHELFQSEIMDLGSPQEVLDFASAVL